jgi:hypothetical protein
LTVSGNDRLRELNLELLETTAIAAKTVLDYSNVHRIAFPERRVLGHLLKRAASILNEIGMIVDPQIQPLSDAILQGKRPDGDLTAPLRGTFRRIMGDFWIG